jgi:formylglycine-generating enzyme required for sulfatase activity
VFALTLGSGADAAEQKSLDDAISLDLGNGAKLDLVLIRPGSFTMGDANGSDNEKPAHKVNISKPFYMGKYEVTQAQWEAVMGNNPSNFKEASNPVEQVSWEDC